MYGRIIQLVQQLLIIHQALQPCVIRIMILQLNYAQQNLTAETVAHHRIHRIQTQMRYFYCAAYTYI